MAEDKTMAVCKHCGKPIVPECGCLWHHGYGLSVATKPIWGRTPLSPSQRSLTMNEQKESTCKHCGKPIFPRFGWHHADGFYSCNKARPMPNPTYAEPKEPENE